MTHQITSDSESRTMDIAAKLVGRLQPGDIVALEGPLGAGKTCFVRGLARGLGVDPKQVSSPTFVICQEYSANGPTSLVHVDAYRLRGAEELESIGWEQMMSSRDAVIAVEWPSRIETALADTDVLYITMEHAGESTRLISIDATGAMTARLEGFHA